VIAEIPETKNLGFDFGDIEKAYTFDPFTHVYMFDTGFNEATHKSLAIKFNQRYFIISLFYQKI
jgi:hypothetical protein